MLYGIGGEVNPTHAYYNGSRTSQASEDPSWSTSIKTRRQRRHLQHWKRLGCHFIMLYLYLLGTLAYFGWFPLTTEPNILRDMIAPNIVSKMLCVVNVVVVPPENDRKVSRAALSQERTTDEEMDESTKMLRTYRLKESLSSKHAKKVRAELAIDDPAAVVTVKPATKQTVKNIANEFGAAKKLNGMYFRVPTMDESVFDLNVMLEKSATYNEIKADRK
ncbi:multidrug resistance-associated protein 5 [Tanacetum coccineum]